MSYLIHSLQAHKVPVKVLKGEEAEIPAFQMKLIQNRDASYKKYFPDLDKRKRDLFDGVIPCQDEPLYNNSDENEWDF